MNVMMNSTPKIRPCLWASCIGGSLSRHPDRRLVQKCRDLRTRRPTGLNAGDTDKSQRRCQATWHPPPREVLGRWGLVPGVGYVGHMSLPPDANRTQPDHLPTPFSAADIRAGCPFGRTIQLQSEAPGGELTFLPDPLRGGGCRRRGSGVSVHRSRRASDRRADTSPLQLARSAAPRFAARLRHGDRRDRSGVAVRNRGVLALHGQHPTTDLSPSGSPKAALACPFRWRSGWAASLSAGRS